MTGYGNSTSSPLAAVAGTILYWCFIGMAVFILGQVSIRLFGHPSTLYSRWRPAITGYGWIAWLSIIALLLYKL